MTSIVLQMLKVMSKKVEQISVNKKDNAVTSDCVTQWQRCYQMIHRLVHEMNQAFGLILLIVLVFQFIWVTSTIFIIIQRFKASGYYLMNTYIVIGVMLVLTILITFMVSIPHRIKGEVTTVYTHFL